MTVFLTRVTGAALNEKGMRESKPGYDEYVRRTSGFIPPPPKKAGRGPPAPGMMRHIETKMCAAASASISAVSA